MTQLVFIPDRRSSRDQVVASLQDAVDGDESLQFVTMAGAMPGAGTGKVRGSRGLQIVDFVERSGAALVTVTKPGPEPTAQGGQFYPVVHYTMAVAKVRVGRARLAADVGPAGVDFLKIVLVGPDHKPVAGAMATLRLKGSKQQLHAISHHTGVLTFGLRAAAVEDALLMVEPGFSGHWGYFNPKVSFASGSHFELKSIDFGAGPDCLRHLIRPGESASGTGVNVAVIDSGVGPHDDLRNVCGDEDSSIGHGTHVAGIIAGSGAGRGGIAPAAYIRSYRVFGDPSTGIARNFDIHRAIEQAVEDDCHLINLSLKVERDFDPGHDDKVLSRAIEDAADNGVLIVAAAGNDFRRFVAFPARHPDVIAVSAMGWEPGLPANAYDRWPVSTDRGDPNKDLFFASFSNEGDVDLIGPGVGVVSTVPHNRYAPMSGTSMACPAITGMIARILSRHENQHIFAMPRDRTRFVAMRNIAFARLATIGFGQHREGFGMVVDDLSALRPVGRMAVAQT